MAERTGSLANTATATELIARIERLTPETSRRWGTMTAHEMLCHLADSFRSMLGERQASMVAASRFKRNAMRVVALHLPMRWPRGIPTRPEVDPKRGGTRPAVFDADRREVISLIQRFAADGVQYASHPMFGEMPRRDWLIWGYRHVDHHLRQFGC